MSTSKPFAYICTLCGCTWRNNHDGTMSLYGANSKSCKVCEDLPLSRLKPLFENRTVAPKMSPVEITQYTEKDIQDALSFEFK